MWRVAVVEPSLPLRRLAVAIVESQPGMRVVAEVESGAALQELLDVRRVDLVVLSGSLPDVDAAPFVAAVLDRRPDLTVVLLLEDGDLQHWRRARDHGAIVAGDWPDLETRLAELAGVVTTW